MSIDNMDFGNKEEIEQLLKEKKAEVFEQKFDITKKDGSVVNANYGWALSWSHGTINLGLSGSPEEIGRGMAAMFIYLWEKGVDCSVASEICYRYWGVEMDIRKK